MSDDFFDKISSSAATVTGNYLRDGDYLLVVKECKMAELQGGVTWVTEFIVVASQPLPGRMQVGGEPCASGTPGEAQVIPQAPGEKASFVAQLQHHKNAMGNVKSFCLGLFGKTESQFNADEQAAKAAGKESPFKQVGRAMTSDAQFVRGWLIRATTTRKVNQGRDTPANKGKILTIPSWTHVPPNPADIALRKQLIETGQPIPVPAGFSFANVVPASTAAAAG